MGSLQFGEPEKLPIEENPRDVIQNAVRVILEGLGEDASREGLKKTPLRVAKAFLECASGSLENPKVIVEGALFSESATGSVNVQGLHHFSLCESCLLPFHVTCHVSYLPKDGIVVGLSKLSRVSSLFCKRLQDPQRLADEICVAFHNELNSSGVGVVLQCQHIKFPNLESLLVDPETEPWVSKCTRSGSGFFKDESNSLWVDFLRHLKLGGNDVRFSSDPSFCSHQFSLNPPKSEMVSAVGSIIRALGENPSRKELVDTPKRFVGWLMNFHNFHLEMKLNSPVKEPFQGAKEHMHCEPNLSLWSQCEHHLLPFYGKVHICLYGREGSSFIGRPLLQSIVHFYGFKLQVQERLTAQIAKTIGSIVDDVLVVAEARHMCMMCRGVRQIGSKTVTEVRLGRFLSDKRAQDAAWDSIVSSTD